MPHEPVGFNLVEYLSAYAPDWPSILLGFLSGMAFAVGMIIALVYAGAWTVRDGHHGGAP